MAENLPAPRGEEYDQEEMLRVFAELYAQGTLTGIECARRAGYTPQTAKRWRRMVDNARRKGLLQQAESEVAQMVRDEYREVIRAAQLEVMQNFRTRVAIRDDEEQPGGVRLKAAEELDRQAGFTFDALEKDPEFKSLLQLDKETIAKRLRERLEKLGITPEELVAETVTRPDGTVEVEVRPDVEGA